MSTAYCWSSPSDEVDCIIISSTVAVGDWCVLNVTVVERFRSSLLWLDAGPSVVCCGTKQLLCCLIGTPVDHQKNEDQISPVISNHTRTEMHLSLTATVLIIMMQSKSTLLPDEVTCTTSRK